MRYAQNAMAEKMQASVRQRRQPLIVWCCLRKMCVIIQTFHSKVKQFANIFAKFADLFANLQKIQTILQNSIERLTHLNYILYSCSYI